MFEWIQDYSLLEYCRRQEQMNFGDRSRFFMHTVTVDTPSGMTALAQYFIAGSVLLDMDFNITVPVPDEQLLQQVMEEVAPHFGVVRQLERKGRIESVHMNQLKPGSVKLFHETETGILLIMKDLYRHNDSEHWYSGQKRRLVHYTVDPTELEPYEDAEVKKVQALLQQAYFGGEAVEFGIMPLGWPFDDSLRHSAALRFVAGFAPNLTLSVDEYSNEVILLNIAAKEPVHKLYLPSAQPQPPRRVNHYLYLNVGHGLVYVVNLLVQPVITKWESFADAKLYSLGENTDFADFEPGTAECLEGISLFFDEDTLQRMMDEVNQALKFG